MLLTAVSLLADTDDIVITMCVLPTSDTYPVDWSVLKIIKLVLSDISTKRISVLRLHDLI